MNNDDAVSPVIGVLLMLTLTLIVAAIVNSYAGGLVETETKAPSITLHVSFSQEDGMKIQHVSGDPLPVSSIKVVIKPTDTMGKRASQYSSEVNKSCITNLTDTESWESGISSLRPGEVAYILFPQKEPLIQTDIEAPYKISNPDNKGNTFYLEVYYRNSLISKNEVLIE